MREIIRKAIDDVVGKGGCLVEDWREHVADKVAAALETRETNDYQKEIMLLARERLDAIAKNRECIIEAFIAKYGVGPEQIVQKIHQDGTVECWKVELTEDGKKALESSEGRALALLREAYEAVQEVERIVGPYPEEITFWPEYWMRVGKFLADQPKPEPTDEAERMQAEHPYYVRLRATIGCPHTHTLERYYNELREQITELNGEIDRLRAVLLDFKVWVPAIWGGMLQKRGIDQDALKGGER